MPEILRSDPTLVDSLELKQKADAHLSRLLGAQNAEIPWFRSLWLSVCELLWPEPLPPLEITSKPVAVKDIWGLYDANPQSRYISAALHIIVFVLLMFVFVTPQGQKLVKQSVNLIDPNIRPYIPDQPKLDAGHGGGGGGDRSLTPVSKGQLPKPKKTFVPPMIVTNPNPRLVIDASLIAPPENLQNNISNWGDPLAKLGLPSNGIGSDTGMGSGKGGGVGPGAGPGFGPGGNGGFGDGALHIGGGVSAPTAIYKPEPEYSEEARKAKYSGRVVLSIVVDAEGRVRDIRVAKSLGMGLDEKAMEAVDKWKFRPGMKDGKPVPVIANIDITFQLL